ncbi:MAG: glutathione S-transferase family protein [Paracoccus denitrificans]|uniref:Glutathione S-transferase family protein n=1 Tax=Paracoccus denitrificans TaxID=266 RepID=A0A533I4Z6_PARDE|nr:MAG: glutathione S-transferase family protein [Paracoccus denitrificans]
MPLLHWSPRSPYVRKAMVGLHEKGLADRVDTTRTAADPMVPHEGLMEVNPLSKIPTLERDEAPAIWDSRVILEWADMTGTTGPRLFPADPEARLLALRDEATGTGLLDIALAQLIETRLRPAEQQSAALIAANRRKMTSVLDWLEANIESIAARPFDAGHLSLGVALCYLDFRFAAEDWPGSRPRLAAWHQGFRARPSVIATEFRDDPRPAG